MEFDVVDEVWVVIDGVEGGDWWYIWDVKVWVKVKLKLW